MTRLLPSVVVVSTLIGAAIGQESQPSEPPWRARVATVDDDGRPVAGVEVHSRLACALPYSEASRRDFRAVTDAAGIATFDTMPPGEPVVFEVALEPWVPTRSGVEASSPPSADGSIPAIPIVLTRGRTLRLAVADALGAPVPGAEVRILPLVEPRLARAGHTEADADRGSTRSGHTGADGVLALERLPAEVLTVEVRADLLETRMIVVDLRAVPSADATVRTERDVTAPGASMPWMPSVAAAFATADAAGLPVLFAMAMDGERANDRLASHHFRDPEVVRVAELIPCLVSSVFGAGGLQADNVSHGETDGVCTRYGSVPCAAHVAVEAYARRAFLAATDEFEVPRTILVAPDGSELAHRTYYLTERELRWTILRALRRTGSAAAVWVSSKRLHALLLGLASADDAEGRRSAALLATLINAGDEYALALVQDFPSGLVRAPARKAVLDGLLLEAVEDPSSALLGFLRDPEPAIRLRAWQRLRTVADRLDPETLVPLLAVEESDDAVMAAALKALGVEDQTTTIQVTNAESGSRYLIVEMLLETLDAASIRGVDAVLDQFGTEGRNRILRALAWLPEDESAVRRLFGHAAAPGPSAVPALRALALRPGGLDARAVELLVLQARAESAVVRQEALARLGRSAAVEAVPALAAALDDACEPVRTAAAIGLWRHGDRRGAKLMIDAFHDPELGPEIRGLFEQARATPGPMDQDGWRSWLREAGVIVE